MKRAHRPCETAQTHQELQLGLVVAAYGRHCVVESPLGDRVICHPRGKKLRVVVGDQVQWLPSQDEGTIETILPRRNLLYRQDTLRTKYFAANLDQALILLAAQPEFSEHQLARVLIACTMADITPLIALNKADLSEHFRRAWTRLAPYRNMSYAVWPLAIAPEHDELSVSTSPSDNPPLPLALPALLHHLAQRTTLILGPSGVGKSTLINAAVPDVSITTAAISLALNSGRHSTTSTTWYWLDAQRQTALIDSPGFQEFGLRHIGPMQLAAYMPDIRPHVAHCRFYNCTHLHEPGCGVIAAVGADDKAGPIAPNRYKIYCDLFAELSAG